MTSSISLKKIVSIGAALLLAVGGSLVATPAQAAVSVTAPVVTPAGNVTSIGSLSSTYSSWSGVAYGGGGPTVIGWKVCDILPTATSAIDGTDFPSQWNCEFAFTNFSGTNPFNGTGMSLGSITALGTSTSTISNESLVGKYIMRFEMLKNLQDNTIYGWAISTPQLIVGAPPVASSPNPAIVGAAAVGSILTAGNGTWSGSPTSYRYQWVSASILNNICHWSESNITGATSSTYTIQSSDAGKCINVKVWASNANGESATPRSASSGVLVPGSVSNNNSNNNVVSYQPCAGQNSVTSVTATASSLARTGTYRAVYNGTPSLTNCIIPVTGYATARYLNGVLNGTIFYVASTQLIINATDRTLTGIETAAGRQLVAGDVITFKTWLGLQASPTTEPATFTYTLTISGGSTSTDSTDVVDVAPITEDMRPLPVWASNIVASIPTLTKSLVTTGGSVSLTGGDYADLKSVTIGGKAVAFKIETTGNVSIPVPAGEAGKTADIVVVFGGGVLTVQDAIKYVAPFSVAKIGERPIAIGAGAKKITEAVADQIRQAAFANMTNNTISCVAYAVNNTAAAKAAAKLTAVQACGIATKANPGLKAAEITVIVNKTKAKKEAVGIKVYKATN